MHVSGIFRLYQTFSNLIFTVETRCVGYLRWPGVFVQNTAQPLLTHWITNIIIILTTMFEMHLYIIIPTQVSQYMTWTYK